MTRPRRAIAAIAAATLTVLAVGAAPASAERVRHVDAKRDVVSLFSLGSPDTDLRVVPGNKNTDITRTVMRHSPNRVIMRTHFRDLTPATGIQIFQIETDKGLFQATQLLGRDFEGGIIVGRTQGLPRAFAKHNHRFELYSMRTGPVECEGLTYWGHRKKDVARMSIPRSCLGNPSWVRMGAGVLSIDMVKEQVYVDDALNRGMRMEDLGMSRKLKRG